MSRGHIENLNEISKDINKKGMIALFGIIINNIQRLPYFTMGTAAPFSFSIKNCLNCLSLTKFWYRLRISIRSPSFLIYSVIAIKFFLFLSPPSACKWFFITPCIFHSATVLLRLSLRISSLRVFILRMERFIAMMYFTSTLRHYGFRLET